MERSDWKLARELAQLRQTLERRVATLEGAAGLRPGRLGRFAAFMGPALPQFITGLIVLVVGFALKDSVDLAIRQQQLQLSFVTSMKAGLDEMARERAPLASVEQAAVVLASFGRPAILPLINELRQGGNRTIGAEAGLATLALTEPEEVCRLVLRSLARSSQLFDAEGYGAAVRILVAGDCSRALDTLAAHAERASRLLAELEKAVAEGKPAPGVPWLRVAPTVPQLRELTNTLASSVAALKPSRS
jgi:hypothetical protein